MPLRASLVRLPAATHCRGCDCAQGLPPAAATTKRTRHYHVATAGLRWRRRRPPSPRSIDGHRSGALADGPDISLPPRSSLLLPPPPPPPATEAESSSMPRASTMPLLGGISGPSPPPAGAPEDATPSAPRARAAPRLRRRGRTPRAPPPPAAAELRARRPRGGGQRAGAGCARPPPRRRPPARRAACPARPRAAAPAAAASRTARRRRGRRASRRAESGSSRAAGGGRERRWLSWPHVIDDAEPQPAALSSSRAAAASGVGLDVSFVRAVGLHVHDGLGGPRSASSTAAAAIACGPCAVRRWYAIARSCSLAAGSLKVALNAAAAAVASPFFARMLPSETSAIGSPPSACACRASISARSRSPVSNSARDARSSARARARRARRGAAAARCARGGAPPPPRAAPRARAGAPPFRPPDPARRPARLTPRHRPIEIRVAQRRRGSGERRGARPVERRRRRQLRRPELQRRHRRRPRARAAAAARRRARCVAAASFIAS